jgi:putative phosphoribosyl transferase
VSLFEDRRDAGRQLGVRLQSYAGRPDVIVLGLPRGGVPVAAEVARALGVPLDVFVVRKLGVPGREELAMGAIASGGVEIVNENVIHRLGVSEHDLDDVVALERVELERRELAYRGRRPPLDLTGKTVIVVDDGLATGASMRAAVAAIRTQRPAWIVAAAPVASAETCDEMRDETDEVVCAETPPSFMGVGQWYGDFSQTSDEEVRAALAGGP